MGGKASTESKNKWNRNNYDRIEVLVPKGQKEILRKYAEEHGMSMNELFVTAVTDKVNNG